LWYEEGRPRLGDEFILRLNESLGRIVAMPESFAPWPGTDRPHAVIRRAGLQQFPYFIAYGVDAERALVLAIAHARRRPLYWLSRATRDRP
jgi:hypothetical protein